MLAYHLLSQLAFQIKSLPGLIISSLRFICLSCSEQCELGFSNTCTLSPDPSLLSPLDWWWVSDIQSWKHGHLCLLCLTIWLEVLFLWRHRSKPCLLRILQALLTSRHTRLSSGVSSCLQKHLGSLKCVYLSPKTNQTWASQSLFMLTINISWEQRLLS